MDRRVAAIREDPKVGRNTCSTIDECYSDADLAAELDSLGITAARSAVRWARKSERIREDYAADIRATVW